MTAGAAARTRRDVPGGAGGPAIGGASARLVVAGFVGAALVNGAAGTGAHAQPSAGQRAAALAGYEVVGDAIPAPLGGLRGDPERGRAIVGDRRRGLCLLCHAGPFPGPHAQGDLAPALDGAGARWSEGQLRLRIVDARRIDPDTPMPAYYRVDGLRRVGAAWAGRPVLDAGEIEDVVAYLVTLRGDRAAASASGSGGVR